MPRSNSRFAWLALAGLACVACGPAKRKLAPAPVEAGPPTSSYAFVGDQMPRSVHWTSAGDLVSVSAGAIWRLPNGNFEAGAMIEDVPGLTASAYQADRWLVGGRGFVSLRDPRTLSEVRRFDVEGTVDALHVSPDGAVAVVESCEERRRCVLSRLALDGSSQQVLERRSGDAWLSPDGQLTVLASNGGIEIFQGASTTPIYQHELESWSMTVVFAPDGSVLFAAGVSVGRFDPQTRQAKLGKLPTRGDAGEPGHVADPAHGRIVSSYGYDGPIYLYDGAVRSIAVGDPGCGGALPVPEDPNLFECPRSSTRVDAGGTFQKQASGTTVQRGATAFLRWYGQRTCELVDSASGNILAASTRSLCNATFSPDGKRLAFVDDEGALRVDALGAAESLREPLRATRQVAFEQGALAALIGDHFVVVGSRDFGATRFGETERLEITPTALFLLDASRILGFQPDGKERLHAVDPANDGSHASSTLFASGQRVVTGAYGPEAERKTAACRFDAQCTEIEIAPAREVVSYQAPWIVTSTSAEPDAPDQVVYYLRHDEGQEPPRRIVAGHNCEPPLLADGGARLVCPSGDRVLWFDTKTGEALGEPRPFDTTAPPAPKDELGLERKRYSRYRGGTQPIVGLGAGTAFLRTNDWLERGIHVVERPLPGPGPEADAGAPGQDADAGAPGAAVRSVALVTPSFALVRGANGAVRIGGDAAGAARFLACRRGSELLPWSACAAASPTP